MFRGPEKAEKPVNTADGSTKTCFVTIGATASFAGLVRATTSAPFVTSLAKHGYTDLIVQYGADGRPLFDECCAASAKVLQEVGEQGRVSVTGFPVDSQGLDGYFRKVKKNVASKTEEGLIVSHAGTGTILGAMRMNLPIVVVSNEELLDNHQVELAEALAEQGYVVHGHVGALSKAIDESEELRKGLNGWPPVNSGKQGKSASIKKVMDEEMAFLD